ADVFSASLLQDSAPERLWNPNELFTQQFQETYRQPLTQLAMAQLRDATQLWVGEITRLTRKNRTPSQRIEQTRVAYDARRDPAAASGEYDFAFRSTPPVVPLLSVSDWEKTLASPALVWL